MRSSKNLWCQQKFQMDRLIGRQSESGDTLGASFLYDAHVPNRYERVDNSLVGLRTFGASLSLHYHRSVE